MGVGEIRAGRAFVEMTLRGGKKVGTSLKRMGARFLGLGQAIAKMAAVGGAAVVGFAALALRKFAKIGDQIDKMSKRVGASTEFLSQMGFAAEQSGASLEDVGQAMQRMNRRLGRITAGQGTSSQVEAMDALGLSLERLQQLSPEERFLELADAIANYGDQAEAAGLAQRAFGTGVDRLLPLLIEGRDGIRALMQEADVMGRTISADQAASAAQLVDAWNRVKSAASGFMIFVGGSLAPVVTKFLDSATENMIELREKFLDSGAEEFEDAVASSFASVIDLSATVIDSIDAIRIGFVKAQLAAVKFTKFLADRTSDVQAYVELVKPILPQGQRLIRDAPGGEPQSQQPFLPAFSAELGKEAAQLTAAIAEMERDTRRSGFTQALRDMANDIRNTNPADEALEIMRSGGELSPTALEHFGGDMGAGSFFTDALNQGITSGGEAIHGAMAEVARGIADMQEKFQAGLAAVDVEVGDRSARGTFSSAAAGFLGRQGGTQERVLEATLVGNRLHQKTIDAIKNLKLTWGA